MIFKAASEDRPYHLGPFPLEALPRDRRISGREAARPGVTARQAPPQPDDPFRRALLRYLDLFATRRDGKVADRTAPVPDDPERRAIDIKGGGYFLNASQLGICRIPESAWLRGIVSRPHSHAVVVLVEHGRVPEEDNLARSWTQNGIAESARLRSAEIAICLAGHIRQMGYSARAHVAGHSELDLDRLAVLAGLALRSGAGLTNPFLGHGFAPAALSTAYELAEDAPLAEDAGDVGSLAYWLGIGGAESGRERNRRASRATHLSRYPMEQVRRVDRPTTLILDDEVPRVPKRAAFFDASKLQAR